MDQVDLLGRRAAEGEDCLWGSCMEAPLRMRSWEAVARIRPVSGLLHGTEPVIPGPPGIFASVMVRITVAPQKDQDPMTYIVTARRRGYTLKSIHKIARQRNQGVRLAHRVAPALD